MNGIYEIFLVILHDALDLQELLFAPLCIARAS